MLDVLKESLRQDFRQRRRALGSHIRAELSSMISQTVIGLPAYANAAGVAAFWPLEEEVDMRPLIDLALANRRRIYLPRINKSENNLEFCLFNGDPTSLSTSTFGIMEPRTPKASRGEIDFVIVPGLAFDLHRHRLGYGAGYYDKFLETLTAVTVGVAFDTQTIDILPIAKHDVAMDIVVTESRIF